MSNHTFYVATNGNDNWSGTQADAGKNDGPFATLARARDAIREYRKSSPETDVTVLLRGGTYTLPETLVFNLEDSADQGSLTFAAYPDEQPVLSAGVPVEGWIVTAADTPGLPKNAVGKVWAAALPDAVDYCHSLFKQGRFLPRAAGAGFIPTVKHENQRAERHVLHFPAGAVPADAAERGLEFRIIPHYPWVMNLLPIDAVDPDACTARTSVPGTYSVGQLVWGAFPKGTCWLENALEHIAPGTWVLNKATRTLYLWPTAESEPQNITVPALTELIRVEGDIDNDGPTDRPVTGIHFQRIRFTQADHQPWTPDKSGWGLQHDWEMFDRPTAMLHFRGAEDCSVMDCEFADSGAAGIRCDLHAQNICISHNHIHDLGGVGVLLAGYGPGTKDVNHHNQVTDNHVHHVGRILWHAAGIFAWQSGHNEICHNHVHHVSYCGIVVSGRIHMFQSDGEASKTVRYHELPYNRSGPDTRPLPWREREPWLHGRGNRVAFNDLHHCMERLGDGNAIYISGTGDNIRVEYNYIHDIISPRMNAAIRCDDDQHGTTIHANLIANCCGEGFIIKGANTITNNIVYGLRHVTPDGTACTHNRGYLVLPYGDCTGAVIEHNIFYAVEAETPLLTESKTASGKRPPGLLRQCRADRNLYFNAADPDWAARHFAEQRPHGVEADSVGANPRFINPSAGDFRLADTSPAFDLGIQPLTADNAGPRRSQVLTSSAPV